MGAIFRKGISTAARRALPQRKGRGGQCPGPQEKALLKEACVESLGEIDAALAGGASRVELCSRLDAGGFTPEAALVRYAAGKGLAVAAMIRRREGFSLEAGELPALESDIRAMKAAGARDLVFGFVLYGGAPRLDLKTMAVLASLCPPCGAVCHMAFDELATEAGQKEALHALSALGFCRVLTKGGPGKAMDNMPRLRALREYADRLNPPVTVLCGGGVTGENYQTLALETGIREFHGRRLCRG